MKIEFKQFQKKIHLAFQVSLFLKGIVGFSQVVGGLLLIFIRHATINHIVLSLTQYELAENPKDFVANHLIYFAQHLSTNIKLFTALYLLTHGMIKIFLVVELLRRRLWSYPLSIVVLISFIAFQLYQLSHHYSLAFLLLTIFDLMVIILIWAEYKNVEKIVNQRKAI